MLLSFHVIVAMFTAQGKQRDFQRREACGTERAEGTNRYLTVRHVSISVTL